MFWKTSFGESDYQSGEFLQNKFRDQCLKEIPIKSKGHARGVNKKKKDNILEKLVEMMPKNRRSFWESLPENEAMKLVRTLVSIMNIYPNTVNSEPK